MVKHFLSNDQNLILFGPYNFVQFSPACGPNTYQIMYGETLDLQCNVSISNSNIKYPNEKSIFGVNLPLKLFSATVANADNRSLNSRHIPLRMFVPHASEFEQNRMVQTTRNFGRCCVAETTINLKTTIYQCSKNYISPTRATRLKVAPNMADPISIKDSVSSLIKS